MWVERPTRRDVAVPLALLALQALWWPLEPWWSGAQPPGLARLLAVAVLCAVACGALAFRGRAPEAVLAATAVVTALGWHVAADAVSAPVAVAVALYSLSLRRTAAVAAAGAAGVVVAAAATTAARGGSLRETAGVALVVGAGAAGVWAVGRRRRRALAERRARAAMHDAAVRMPAFAAAAERRRLAAALHDVVAHRLTGVVVSAGAARRLADPARRADALAHAVEAGGRALAELDDIAAAQAAPPTLADLERLCAEHPGTALRCTVTELPVPVAALTNRVVREALTNASRYAHGARIDVAVQEGDGHLRVVVDDHGGVVTNCDVGTGQGLNGLRALVGEAGGRFSAGRHRDGGWRVRADLPLPWGTTTTARWSMHRTGAAARDRAMAVLALGLSTGIVLLPGPDDADPFDRPGPTTVLLALLVLHALPLAWRRLAPGAALAAACLCQAALVLCTVVQWIPLDPAETFLWTWWVEVALVYAIGAHSPGAAWQAPLAVAVLGGAALAAGDDIHGSRPAAGAVLAVGLGLLLVPVWAVGRMTGARRRRREQRNRVRRQAVRAAADTAAHEERRRVMEGLHDRARRHVAAMLAAGGQGDLETAERAARAGLQTLRHLVHEEEELPDPPPGLLGIRSAATAHRCTVRVLGVPRDLPAPVDVAAQEAVAALLVDGAVVTVSYLRDALELAVKRPEPPTGDPGLRRFARLRPGGADRGVARARHLVDACGGAVSTGEPGGTVQLWLPLTLG